jgi:hypothetical protein
MKPIFIPILLLFNAISLLGQSAKVVDVCELLSDMSRWNGQFVQFDAKIDKGGGEQGPWVEALECLSKVKIGQVEFPNALEITDPQSPQRLHHVEFERDEDSRTQFRSLLAQIKDRRTEYVRGTVVGVFETRTPLSKLVVINKAWPNGLPAGGFGHLGSAPAQILVKTITDMRIEKRKAVRER